MILPKLFKYTVKGQVQSWQIFTHDNTYWTEEGIHQLTKSDPTVCVGKNVGKKNETTPSQQAEIEARAKFQKKLDKGYNTVLTKEEKFFSPMLARTFNHKDKNLFKYPTYVQPKLDGVRCYLDNKILKSRAGKTLASCPHLELPYHGLDGELYNHDLKHDFNKIISLTRKIKPTLEDLEESKKLVQYWVYDYPYYIDKVFSERYKLLNSVFSLFPNTFKLVPMYPVFSLEDIERYHNLFISQGYEGTMIRLDTIGYEKGKRAAQLLKYKNWQDAEWTILDVSEGEGNRANCAATLNIDVDGVKCNPTMTGTQEFMEKVLKDKAKVIGKQVTVKYFGFTEDGSLRFPTVKHIHDYE